MHTLRVQTNLLMMCVCVDVIVIAQQYHMDVSLNGGTPKSSI